MLNPLKQTLMTGKYIVFNAVNQGEIKQVADYVAEHPDDSFTFMINDIYPKKIGDLS